MMKSNRFPLFVVPLAMFSTAAGQCSVENISIEGKETITVRVDANGENSFSATGTKKICTDDDVQKYKDKIKKATVTAVTYRIYDVSDDNTAISFDGDVTLTGNGATIVGNMSGTVPPVSETTGQLDAGITNAQLQELASLYEAYCAIPGGDEISYDLSGASEGEVHATFEFTVEYTIEANPAS